jgi:hypothetical protein
MRHHARFFHYVFLFFVFLVLWSCGVDAGVVAVFELSWTSTLQTTLPIAGAPVAENNNNNNASTTTALLEQLLMATQADGGGFTNTLNRVLVENNLDDALVVGGVSAQESFTPALSTKSCVVVNRGSLRNFVNASTGLCQICTVCRDAYVATVCGGKSDAACVSECADGQYVYTSGIQPPELGGCARCPAGTSSPSIGIPCAPCAAGTIAPQTGATACVACAVGTIAADGVACLTVRPWPSLPYKKHTTHLPHTPQESGPIIRAY